MNLPVCVDDRKTFGSDRFGGQAVLGYQAWVPTFDDLKSLTQIIPKAGNYEIQNKRKLTLILLLDLFDNFLPTFGVFHFVFQIFIVYLIIDSRKYRWNITLISTCLALWNSIFKISHFRSCSSLALTGSDDETCKIAASASWRSFSATFSSA